MKPSAPTPAVPHRMRILISGHLPPPMGGMAAFYETLLNSSLPSLVELDFVRTSSQKRAFEKSGSFSLSNVGFSLADYWRFARALMIGRPQVAHIGTALGLSFVKHSICVVMARLLGCKVLLHPHCSLSALYEGRPSWWRWSFRQVIGFVHGVIALSREWERLPDLVPRCKVFALPNGINLTAYSEVARVRLVSPPPARALHVLYLGYIGRAKGSFDLVEAAGLAIRSGLRWEVRLIGGELTPGECTILSQRITGAGLSDFVRICPPVAGPDKLDAYRWADVLVYPSYHEGMPMAVIEAMACSIPVVASRVGGLPDLVEDGVNGLLLEPGRPEQILEGVRRLADDPMLRASMGRQGYLRATADYNFEGRVARLVEIYQSLLG